MTQCVFTDANQSCSSGMVTQIPTEDENKPVHLQRHEPLGFVGHRFNKCEMNWTVAETEGFAIKDTKQKLGYLLQRKKPFKLFSDHKYLIQIFSLTNVSNRQLKNCRDGLYSYKGFVTELTISTAKTMFGPI